MNRVGVVMVGLRQVKTRRLGRVLAALLMACLMAGSANAFQLQDIDRNRVDLNDYAGDGRWTLVMFWATDCSPCEAQKPMIDAFHQKYKDSTAHVVGVALDGHEEYDAINELLEEKPISFPTLVAFSDVIQRQYKETTGSDYRGTPTYWLYSPAGELVNIFWYGSMNQQLLDDIGTAQGS